MSETRPSPLEKRFQSAVAAWVKTPCAKTKLRMEMAERRMYGVASRNAAKLARNRAQGQ